MPHAALKVIPGLDQNETPTLNEAGLTSSQLVRFIYDRAQGALIQKLGGWTKYYNIPPSTITRALWAWADQNQNNILAFGTQSLSGASQLGIINSSGLQTVTPAYKINNILPVASTTAGSSQVTLTDTVVTGVTQYDAVFIETHISVGGIVLFGFYQTSNPGLSTTTYLVTAQDALSNPQSATLTSASASFTGVISGTSLTASSVTGTIQIGQTITGTGVAAGTVIVSGSGSSWVINTSQSVSSTAMTTKAATVAAFTTTSGLNTVTVTLPNHGYAVGSTYPVLTSTTVAGVTIFGNYVVQSVPNSYSFTINGPTTASASTTAYINGGFAKYAYNLGQGSNPVGSGYGIGGYGLGGYGTGASLVPSLGSSIPATDWTLDNWGQVLISCANSGATTSSATLTGSISSTTLTATAVTGTLQAPQILTGGNVTTGTIITAQLTTTVTYTGSISGTVLTASAVTGTIAAGQTLTGGTVLANTVILSQISGTTGGAGTYNVSVYQTGKTCTGSLGGSGTYSVNISQTSTCTIATLTNVPFQPIYQWDPSANSPQATAIAQGPVINDGIFVAMPQRQIIAWGSSFTGIQDPLLIRWCDVNNYTVWVGQVTNQAGSYRIPRGSRIVGALQGPQQGLIWTDIDVWSMQYVGQPYIYSFTEIATGCGLIGRKAAASINGSVYWMGPSSFFSLTGGGVQPVACPVWDVIFQNLDTTQTSKIRAAVNSRFGEISWYYPTTTSGGEVSNYVKYNVNLGVWDFGTLGRTAWIDQSVLGPPIGADPTSLYLYQHETSTDADGAAMTSNFQTGYFATSEGDYKVFIDQVWPDMKWGPYNGTQNATVNLTFYTADYPGGPVTTYGPYNLVQGTSFISPRLRSRLVSIGVGSNDVGSFWRLGNIRYRYQQDGKY